MNEEKPEQKLSHLEKLEQRKNKIEVQIKAIQAKEKAKERKARTRRLVQIGAITLKYLNMPDSIQPEDFEKVMQRFVALVRSREQQTQPQNNMKGAES